MRVSQKSEYALRAMLELALRTDPKQAVRTAEIARRQRIPEKFLELILVELRRAGLLISQRGPVGGHRLARRPEEISIGAIWRAIDGSVTDSSPSKGSDPFTNIWEMVDKAIADVVDHVTLEDVRKRAEARRAVQDFSI